MIDQIDKEIVIWAQTIHTDAILSPPLATSDRNVICIHLMHLQHEPLARATTREVKLQILLQYLITTCGPDPAECHRLLWELLVSATEHARADGWRVSCEPVPDAIWSAVPTPPRPYFLIGIPANHEWQQPDIPRVTRPPQLQASPSEILRGVVLSPSGNPIDGAQVAAPSLGLMTKTDSSGAFRFGLLPGGNHFPTELVVSARRRQQIVQVPRGQDNHSLTIVFEFKES